MVKKERMIFAKINLKKVKWRSTFVPLDAAHIFNTSGSTDIIATRQEFKLSPLMKENNN